MKIITETSNNPTQSPTIRPSFSTTVLSVGNQMEVTNSVRMDATKDGIVIIYNEGPSVMSLVLFAAAIVFAVFACICFIGICCYKRVKNEKLKAEVVNIKAHGNVTDIPKTDTLGLRTPQSIDDSEDLFDDGIVETMMTNYYSRSIGSELFKNENNKQTTVTSNHSLVFTEEGNIGDV